MKQIHLNIGYGLAISSGEEATTNNMQWSVHYYTSDVANIGELVAKGETAGGTDVDMISALGEGDNPVVVREVTIYNADTVAHTVYLKLTDGDGTVILQGYNIAVGQTRCLEIPAEYNVDGDLFWEADGVGLIRPKDDNKVSVTHLDGYVAPDYKVKYNADDAAAGFLADKVVAGDGISLSEGTGGDVDKLKITGTYAYTLPLAGAARGGIKADTRGEGDTVECKVDGTTEKLYVPAYATAYWQEAMNTISPTSEFYNLRVDCTTGFSLNAAEFYNAFICVHAKNLSTTHQNIHLEKTSDVTDSALPVLLIDHSTSDTPADGFGVYEEVQLETSTTANTTAAKIVTKWSTAAHATATSIREWWLKGAGGDIARVMALGGAGSLTLDKYGDGTFIGIATKYLAVTSDGLVIEQAPPVESKWTRTGTKLTPATAGDLVEVTADSIDGAIRAVASGANVGIAGITATGSGVYGNASGAGYGVQGVSTNIGVYGSGTTGTGVKGDATSGTGVLAVATSGLALLAQQVSTGTDSVATLIKMLRTGGTVVAGFGSSIEAQAESGSGSIATAGYLDFYWTDVTNAAEDAAFKIRLKSAGTAGDKLILADTGQLTLPGYTGTNFPGTSVKNLEVDSSGNVLQSAPTTQVRGFRAETDSFTLSASYVGQHHRVTKSTAVTITFPKNSAVAIPIGTFYSFEQVGAGQLTCSPVDGDVTLNSLGSGLKTYGQYSVIYAVKVDTDVWSIFGGSA